MSSAGAGRWLLFGGSFDPIHHGHLIVSRHVAETLRLDRIVLIPSRTPPHKLGAVLAPIEQRLEMCRLAVAGDPLFEVSDCEAGQSGPNYTLITVTHFRGVLGPGTALHWLIGMDSLGELAAWHRADELVEACTIVTAVRPGFAPPPLEQLLARFSPTQARRLLEHVVLGPQIDIASTELRERVRAGLSLRYQTPDATAEYIAARGLYSNR
jgi:nicotinate-nucleotide adenylyltransferase